VSKISAVNPGEEQEALVDADLDTLATALYVRTDDLLKASPERAPWRPKIGIAPKVSDAELITLAVMQALLGHTSEARWLRYTRSHLRHLFGVPAQAARLQQAVAAPGCHDRLAGGGAGPGHESVDR
jgi:1,2-phenylacetyl-CoA epoxidase catalytic subunit